MKKAIQLIKKNEKFLFIIVVIMASCCLRTVFYIGPDAESFYLFIFPNLQATVDFLLNAVDRYYLYTYDLCVTHVIQILAASVLFCTICTKIY